MTDFLTEVTRSSASRVAAAKKQRSESELYRLVNDLEPPPILEFHPGGFDLMAEIKCCSPSEGQLGSRAELDRAVVSMRSRAYAEGGAAAISVLTEPNHFHGSLDHLKVSAESVSIPVMRKDFIVDPYQVLEARVAGAGGILVITRILENTQIAEILRLAGEVRMFVLIEAFDEMDIGRSVEVLEGIDHQHLQLLVGVNTRDLSTLEVDNRRLQSLKPLIPNSFPVVAESGLQTVDDVAMAANWGYNLALVGAALMRTETPAKLIVNMLDAARERTKKCVSG